MKHFLLILALVGCGEPAEEKAAKAKTAEEAYVLEVAIRKEIEKPTGELTDVDLEKVTYLNLGGNHLTEVKGLEKLTQLTELWLHRNQLTNVTGLEKLTQLTELNLKDNSDLNKAQIDQLQKALPKCEIYSNPTKYPHSFLPVKVLEGLPLGVASSQTPDPVVQWGQLAPRVNGNAPSAGQSLVEQIWTGHQTNHVQSKKYYLWSFSLLLVPLFWAY
jgi:hypothetical protein